MIRAAILDDYQRGALEVADWTLLDGRAELIVFDGRLGDEDAAVAALAGRTLGIVGLGRIGSAVAQVGSAFGMRVLAWSENLTAERAEASGAELVSLADLLAASDVVTVHQVLSDRTRNLIGQPELALMRPTALLVNTSRGPIVSSDALVAAVRTGVIAGAAVDVYDTEPLPADHPLRSTPGILATPHLGYVTRDVYEVFYGEAAEDVASFLDERPLREISG